MFVRNTYIYAASALSNNNFFPNVASTSLFGDTVDMQRNLYNKIKVFVSLCTKMHLALPLIYPPIDSHLFPYGVPWKSKHFHDLMHVTQMLWFYMPKRDRTNLLPGMCVFMGAGRLYLIFKRENTWGGWWFSVAKWECPNIAWNGKPLWVHPRARWGLFHLICIMSQTQTNSKSWDRHKHFYIILLIRVTVVLVGGKL